VARKTGCEPVDSFQTGAWYLGEREWRLVKPKRKDALPVIEWHKEFPIRFDWIVSERKSHKSYSTEASFQKLLFNWKEETVFSSSTSDITSHEAYLGIIGLGRTVVPLIIREMEKEGGHWFVALKAITGENPVPQEHWGDLPRMTEDWLAWGRRKGHR
jgi:hypothetical protein